MRRKGHSCIVNSVNMSSCKGYDIEKERFAFDVSSVIAHLSGFTRDLQIKAILAEHGKLGAFKEKQRPHCEIRASCAYAAGGY